VHESASLIGQMLRIHDAPAIEVHIVESTESSISPNTSWRLRSNKVDTV